MSNEIEDFLRRAAAKRKQQADKSQQAPAPQQPAPRQPQPLSQQREPARLVEVLDEADIEIIEDVEVVEAQSVNMGGSVSAHVEDHLDTSDFRQRTSQMGEKLAQTDEKLDEHLHDVFDHRVGRLGTPSENVSDDVTSVQSDNRSSFAREIAQMLRDPKSIRQAIMLREVLDRPEHRWED